MSLITTVPPHQARPAALSSSSRHIIRARNYEYLPEFQSAQTSRGSGRFVFKISSVDQFLSLKDSYFRFNVVTSLNFNGTPDGSRALAEGGAHALIKKITVSSATGALICETDRYNFLYALLSNAVHSPEYVDSVGHKYGDSYNPRIMRNPVIETLPFALTNSATAAAFAGLATQATWTAATQLLNLGAAYITAKQAGQALVQPGDYLHVQFNDASPAVTGSMWLRVINVGSADEVYCANQGFGPDPPTTTNIVNGGAYNANLGATEIVSIVLYKASLQTRDASRNHVAVGQTHGGLQASTSADGSTSIQVSLQPCLNFFNQEQWFPLFLLTGGIIITIELESIPELCLTSAASWTSGTVAGGWSSADFTISNMRYIGRVIQPSEELKDTYYTMFKKDGLYFVYSNIYWFEHHSTSTSQSQQQSIGKRMVRWICTMIKDKRLTTAYNHITYPTSNALKMESLATGLRAELQKYDYSALSMRYPLDNQVDITNDRYLAQALLFFEQIFGTTVHRFQPWQWASILPDNSTAYESKRFYPCALLSKTNEDFMGLDLINTPLQSNFEFSAVHAPNADSDTNNRQFYNFVDYDCIAYFQQNHGIQVMA